MTYAGDLDPAVASAVLPADPAAGLVAVRLRARSADGHLIVSAWNVRGLPGRQT